MRDQNYFLFTPALLLLLGGCAGVAKSPQPPISIPEPISQPAPVELPQAETAPLEQFPAEVPQAGADTIVEPVPVIVPEAVPDPEPVMSNNPAIIALLDRARIDTGAGKREAAGASLERALRIEPRNPWLWHELAQVRLAQGQYAQGISLARKSNSFAAQERRLQAMNWRVIGDARVAEGNPSEAEQAFKTADALDPAKEPVQAAESGQTTEPGQTVTAGQAVIPEPDEAKVPAPQ